MLDDLDPPGRFNDSKLRKVELVDSTLNLLYLFTIALDTDASVATLKGQVDTIIALSTADFATTIKRDPSLSGWLHGAKPWELTYFVLGAVNRMKPGVRVKFNDRCDLSYLLTRCTTGALTIVRLTHPRVPSGRWVLLSEAKTKAPIVPGRQVSLDDIGWFVCHDLLKLNRKDGILTVADFKESIGDVTQIHAYTFND